jgi:hypothetical protein
MNSFLGFADYAPLPGKGLTPTKGYVGQVRRLKSQTPLTAKQIEAQTGLDSKRVWSAIACLVQSGEVIAVEGTKPKQYRWSGE